MRQPGSIVCSPARRSHRRARRSNGAPRSSRQDVARRLSTDIRARSAPRSSVTRYFTPLLPPGATRHSNLRSKSAKVSSVMMSPLSAVGCPPLATCFNMPDSTSQPCAGNAGFLKPRHPWVVEPSKSRRHPASRSSDDACPSDACGTGYAIENSATAKINSYKFQVPSYKRGLPTF